jgi:hypothetical protein
MKNFSVDFRLRLLPALEAVFAAAFRLLPNLVKPGNLAPVGGFAIYGGARLPLWQAILLPLTAMAISDLALRQMFGWPMFDKFAYVGFVIYALLGRLMLKHSKSWSRIIGVTFLGSLQFYLITNFGVWFSELGSVNAMYSPTLAGLGRCYIQGLPFFAHSLEGDMLFSLGFFALHQWAAKLAPSTARILVPQENQA